MRLSHPQSMFTVVVGVIALVGLVGSSEASALQNWDKKFIDVNKRGKMFGKFFGETVAGINAARTNNSVLTPTNESWLVFVGTQGTSESTRSNDSEASSRNYLQTLLASIKNSVSRDGNSLDDLANSEEGILQQLQQSPQLIDDMLGVYLHLASSSEKQLLRSLLAATGSSDIEKRALEHIVGGDNATKSDWLALIRDMGVSSSDGRGKLFTEMPLLTDPGDLRAALLAITPELVSATERQTILGELTQYLDHADEQVRSATIESLSRWAGSDQAYILEQALYDPSDLVRQAAVFAAFSSKVQSDNIKSSLLTIMKDEEEDWELRMEAHSALTSYSLQGNDYDDYFQFHLKLQAPNAHNGGRKG